MDMAEPEQQIETIRVQMQEMASFLTNEIVNPSQTALLTKREDISSHVSVMCDNLSKFRALLAEIGFDAAGRRSSTNKHVDDFMETYAAGVRKVQERIAKEEKIRIRDKGQLVPFQEPEEYMREYYRLHPRHEEEEEETELTRSVEEHIAMEALLNADKQSAT